MSSSAVDTTLVADQLDMSKVPWARDSCLSASRPARALVLALLSLRVVAVVVTTVVLGLDLS
jgi:hypothetical protein